MSRRLRWILPIAIVLVLVLARHVWMRALGDFLVAADPPAPAEMIVVMAGDAFGHRILKACELMRDGYAPKALISGPCCDYGRPESEPAIAFATSKGCPAEQLVPFPLEASNTIEEASKVVRELRKRGIRNFMVVTSDYHTRRTRRAFARLAPAADFRVVAAPDEFFKANGWWRNRQSQKVFFFEWSKTLATWAGLGS